MRSCSLFLLQQVSRELFEAYYIEELEDVRVIRSRQSSACLALSVQSTTMSSCWINADVNSFVQKTLDHFVSSDFRALNYRGNSWKTIFPIFIYMGMRQKTVIEAQEFELHTVAKGKIDTVFAPKASGSART